MINIQIEGTCKSRISFVYQDSDAVPDIKEVFKGEFLKSFPLLCSTGLTVFVGLGKQEELSSRKLMDAVSNGARELKKYNRCEAEVDLAPVWPVFGLQSIRSAVLGIKLGLYEYGPFRSDRKNDSFRFYLRGTEKTEKAEQCLKKTLNLADSVLYARELVNTPGNLLTPVLMAENMQREAKKHGVQAEILDEEQAVELGMGAFLAVGGSSGNPPKLIVLRYLADPDSKERTALVGKGVTLDTGGYCLKGRDSMLGIKGDMAGGAAVAGAIFALAANKEKTNAVAVIPACENRISNSSFVPGDIVRSMSGKTIEIQNTDAEGRLILADAVTYAIRKEGATRVLDIATLTGAVVGALGFSTAG
ncbi:leucyl aminopeptidase family protein, partial [Caproiciproducens sp.]|uniref:leucyl aminopeptidase family protein n=1 Tax=Caproiciproducens sp. TaxID=1954376 RepID=UPI00289E61D9